MKPTYEYYVRLRGAEIDLHLVSLCIHNERFSVVTARDGPGKEFYELHSPEFLLPKQKLHSSGGHTNYQEELISSSQEVIIIDMEQDRNFETVEEKAEQMLGIINGAAKLYYTEYTPVEVDCIIRKHPYGLYLRSKSPFDKRSYEFSEGDPSWAETINRWAALGLKDPKVEFAFQIYGSIPHNWPTLYLIYEVIRTDCGCAPSHKGWVSRTYESRFTGTANNNRDIETGIRHASHTREYTKALPLHEGQALVRQLLQRWIEEKIKRLG